MPNHSDLVGTIVVGDIQLQEEASGAVLSGRLRTEEGDLAPSLWFHFPPDFAPFLVKNGDPFLPVLLLLAMKERKRLEIEADISLNLLSTTRRIMEIYVEWSRTTKDRFRFIDVIASPVARGERRGSSSGAFFSGGVDSFYTLLRNLSRYPADDPRLIRYLLLVHGFDIPLENTNLFENVRARAETVAQALSKILVPVRTNARVVLRGIDWGAYAQGPALASVGLALGGLLHTVFIPSSYAFVDQAPRWGSHPGLDPLWSTETVEFVHDGGETRRIDKTAYIANSPVALAHLRVCWENRNGAYNCCHCEKCLRTMADLLVCGALRRSESFPEKIEMAALKGLIIPAATRPLWQAIRSRARDGNHMELAAAIEKALARSGRAESGLGKMKGTIGRLRSKIRSFRGIEPGKWFHS